MVTGIAPGGQLTITTDVENYPGFSSAIQGPELMQVMQEQAKNMGCRILTDTITALDVTHHPFVLQGDTELRYVADTVIIATGASARWLGLPSEEHWRGFGVSACATCDGFFFRDKNVAVVGGGNTAVEEALYLTRHAKHVTLIHRRDQLRAEKILQQRLLRHDKITILWDHVVDSILGSDNPRAVQGLRLKHAQSKAEKTLAVEGVFIAIGHDPNTALFRNILAMDDGGYLRVEDGSTKTSVDGIFAAGDVCDSVYRQAVTAAGMGCMAALEAEKYLAAKS